MEDQQPGPGDLTDAPADDATSVEVPEDSDETTSSATDEAGDDAADEAGDKAGDGEAAEGESGEAAESEAAVPKEPSAARQWLSRNKTKVLVGTAVGSFVAAGAFGAAALQPYLVDRATVATKMTIARTAVDTITTLWTYTPQDMDQLPQRSAKYLSGDFQDQYRKFVDAIVATNKQAEVSNTTRVVAAAVESLNGSEATALVYTNTTSTSPKNPVPSVKYLSYRLDLKKRGTDWVVTKMSTVTSLDLTPKM